MARKRKKPTVHWIYLLGLVSFVIILNSLFVLRYAPPRHACIPGVDGDAECQAFCISLPKEDLLKYSEDCGLSSKEIVGTCLPNKRCDCDCIYKPLVGEE